MTVALLPGMVAREVAVSSLATIYAVQGGEEGVRLATLLAVQWSLATGVAFATWYIFAPQCMATVGPSALKPAVGNTPPSLWATCSPLAWLASYIVYRTLSAWGF